MTFVRPRFPSAPDRYDALNEANFRQQVETAILQASGLVIQGDQIESLDAGSITGQLNDAQVAESNVTQHEAALELAASQVTSGQFADARISESSVTQHVSAEALSHARLTAAGQTITTGAAEAAIQWGEDFDSDDYFDSGTSTTVINIPTNGVYEIVAQIDLSNSVPNQAQDVFRLRLLEGGSTLINLMNWHARSTNSMTGEVNLPFRYVGTFSAGDTLDLRAFQNFTSNETIQTTSWLYIRRIEDTT